MVHMSEVVGCEIGLVFGFGVLGVGDSNKKGSRRVGDIGVWCI